VLQNLTTMTNSTGQYYPVINTAGENSYQNNNSEVIAILRDDAFWPETNAAGTPHIYNPQQTPFFNAKPAANLSSPGIATDDVFRDPWGSPYIVTMDLNYDNHCYDSTLDTMYALEGNTPRHLTVPGEAIVWSMGPLKTINPGVALNMNPTNKLTIVTPF
jgi:hypothetical protein